MREPDVSPSRTIKTNSNEKQCNAFVAVDVISSNVHFSIYDSSTRFGVLRNGTMYDTLLCR